MAKAAYIGIKDVSITASNIANFFDVTDGSYRFAGTGSVFTSTNNGVKNSTANTVLTAKQDIPSISFDYSWSSESGYDKFTLKVGGITIKNGVSGATTKESYSGSLTKGQTIEFTYKKDSSTDKNDDECTFSNMILSFSSGIARKITGGYIGIDGIARKIKKAYIGVNNVAKLIYKIWVPNWIESVGYSSGGGSDASVCYGNGKFVAVEYNSSMVHCSVDGINWTSKYSLPYTAYYTIAYGDSKFVAVASGNNCYYSTDGVTWTSATMPNGSWKSVCYGNGKFVAVTGGTSVNVAAYSTDGINWTQTTLPISANWKSVCYGNGKFVAVATNNNTTAYSEDGINWTQTTLPTRADWVSVCYGNGKFVAVANGPGGGTSGPTTIAAYSEDGIIWAQIVMPTSAYWKSVCYGNGKFVAVCGNSSIRSAIAAHSEDGITWTQIAMPTSEYWYSVCYGDGKFVAVAKGTANCSVSD